MVVLTFNPLVLKWRIGEGKWEISLPKQTYSYTKLITRLCWGVDVKNKYLFYISKIYKKIYIRLNYPFNPSNLK